MNSKKHLYLSLIKSVLRIYGCLFGMRKNSLRYIGRSFVLAELLGIAEELVDER